jgi:hypothetical protein
MGGPLSRLLISSSPIKHGRHRQFLFLIGRFLKIFSETIKLGFIWQSGFRGEYFFISTNQKQELPVAAMFVNGSEQNEQSL